MATTPKTLDLSFDSLPDYFEKTRAANAEHRVLGFQDPQSASGAEIQMYTANEILALADIAQVHYKAIKGVLSSTTHSQDEGPVAAIAAYGQINWAASFIALVRLGFTVLALSPNLSRDALHALLLKAKAKILVLGKEVQVPAIENLTVVPIISIKDLQKPISSSTAQTNTSQHQIPQTGFIWHSSGSTGLPKLFPIPQSTAVQRIKSAKYSTAPEHSLWITSSLYNSAGLTFFLAALARPAPTFFWDESSEPSPERLAAFIEAADPQVTTFAPAMLERVAATEKGLELLRTRGRVSTFGAVCPRALGDKLTAQGIRISTGYAMSETSTLMNSSLRPQGDDDWQFMVPLPTTKPFIYMRPFVKGASAQDKEEIELFECVMLKGYPNTPASMSNSDDPPGSFSTGDVFERHPTKPDRWRIVGRRDDQINMGLPVVVSAVEYEEAIKAGLEVDVQEVVVFGDGRLELGVLVFVQPEQMESSAAIRDAVWQNIERSLNRRMRVGISEALILVVSGKIPRTDKGNFARPLIYRQYDDLIAQAYASRVQVNSPL